MTKPRVLVITGNGFNCEQETSYAFSMWDTLPEIVHMNDLLSGEIKMSGYHIMVFIGGFSYGDHLGGGKVVANKFRYRLSDDLKEFISRDTLIIGICNGFQAIAQLGILPGFDGDYSSHAITVSSNLSNRYEDRWISLKANPASPCVFTRNLDFLYLPVRHGEGNLTSPDNSLFDKLEKQNQISLQYIDPETKTPTEKYPLNPNGSKNGIAGICDPTGRIFGLMPHPEAFLSPFNHPFWTRLKAEGNLPEEGDGVKIFRNAAEYFE